MIRKNYQLKILALVISLEECSSLRFILPTEKLLHWISCGLTKYLGQRLISKYSFLRTFIVVVFLTKINLTYLKFPQLDFTELQRLTIALQKNVQWTANRASVWKNNVIRKDYREKPRNETGMNTYFRVKVPRKMTKGNLRSILVWIDISVPCKRLPTSTLVFDNLWTLILRDIYRLPDGKTWNDLKMKN